jgi:hypothetical protein
MKNILYYILIILLLISFKNQHETNTKKSNEKSEKFKLERDIKSKNTNPSINNFPCVNVVKSEKYNCELYHYKSNGLKWKLSTKRPVFDQNTYLCMPAAFSSKIGKIDGFYMKDGLIINKLINSNINGYFQFNNKNFKIDYINSLKLNKENSKSNIFQQFLLLKNKQLVDCKNFKNRKNIRRAIVKYKDENIFIIESGNPITIYEFQIVLQKIGVNDAIYLDMGTYSEGWYKNSENKKVIIGESYLNTNKQTNWLTLVVK